MPRNAAARCPTGKLNPRQTQASIIALDWGTSSARVYVLDSHGAVIAERAAPLGVQRIADGRFAEALATLCAGMADTRIPQIACGMIGSRQGWIEAPYRECPADFDAIASSLTPVNGTNLAIVPGLICRDVDGTPDVMRGEETQVLGALSQDTAQRQVFVLPGTHSKWVVAGPRGIERFATFMSGELFAVLREHSILGRLVAPGSDAAAFDHGVRHSLREAAALTHDLFSARTRALTDELASGSIADYLSGLLIGAEALAASRWLDRQTMKGSAVTLIGDQALVERYRSALAIAGIDAAAGPAGAAPRGMWRIAQHAGMLRG